MADIAVSWASEKLQKLHDVWSWDEIRYLCNEMDELADLVNNPHQMMQQSESIKTLFVKIRELAYDVEDMVDDLLLPVGSTFTRWKPRRRVYKLFSIRYIVKNPSPRRAQIREFTDKTKAIRLRVEECERSINGDSNTRPTTPPPPVGLDHHVSVICQRVLLPPTSPQQWPSVVTVVGMAGIGKSTLARRVFDNFEVKHKFEVFAWLSLSDTKIRGRGRLKMIMGSSEHEEVLEDDDGLSEKVHDLLQGRRYLIVLDNVRWTDQLEKLKAALPAVEGSCVLITTRSIAIAQIFAGDHPSTPPYQLPLLSQELSRLLLQKYISDSKEDMDVESVVHTLLKICRGLPLALNKAGVMLQHMINSDIESGRTYQEILLKGNIMDELLELCLDVVATSFDDEHLPAGYCFSRACYLYLASLCKDGKAVKASKVIRLWVAEEFIPHQNLSSQIKEEDIARGLLNLLLDWSMIQPVHHESTSDLRSDFSVTIHPIYHNLCIRETRDVNRLVLDASFDLTNTTDRNDPPHNPRRLVLYDLIRSVKLIKTPRSIFSNRPRSVKLDIQDVHTTNVTADNDVTTLRSLLIASTKVPLNLDLQPITWLKFLRVIDLVGVRGLSELPDDIGDIITLRYLGLRRCSVLTKLPSSVGTLPLLQTLDIRETGIQQLPETLGEIRTLRHLLVPDSNIRGVDISNLLSLQTLAVHDCEGWLLENGLLNMAENIRALSLKGLGRLAETRWDENRCDETRWDALAASLGRLEKLENLYLHCKDPIRMSTLSDYLFEIGKLRELYLNGPMVQESFTFSSFVFIRELILDGSKMVLDPMPALGELLFLVHLTLKNDAYIGKDMMCARRGGFPSLKSLKLWCLRELKGWIMDQPTLPKLNFLSIRICESLDHLPEDLHYSMASLREMEVIDPRDEFIDKLRHDSKDYWHKINTQASCIKLWRDGHENSHEDGHDVELIKSDMYGGKKGDKWHMMDLTERFLKINIRVGDIIDAISFQYQKGDGTTKWSRLYGGNGGEPVEIDIKREEYLTSIKGHWGEYYGPTLIKSLTFVTNIRILGPYGTETGNAFDLSLGSNSRIVGFYGRSGSCLDALGVVYMQSK